MCLGWRLFVDAKIEDLCCGLAPDHGEQRGLHHVDEDGGLLAVVSCAEPAVPEQRAVHQRVQAEVEQQKPHNEPAGGDRVKETK